MDSDVGFGFCSGCHEKPIEGLEAGKGGDWMSAITKTFWPLSGKWIVCASLEEGRPVTKLEWFRREMMGGTQVEVEIETNGRIHGNYKSWF